MSRKANHLKDELRRTFTIYALIPTFIIASFVIVLTFAYWETTVLDRNQERLDAAAKELGAMIGGYLDKANAAAIFCRMEELKTNKTVKTEMYRNLYKAVNNVGVRTDFYIFDAQLNKLISNQTQEPEFVELARSVDWGIIGQLKKNRAVPVFSFAASLKEPGGQMDLVIGKAIEEEGSITGYIVFVVPSEQLVGLLANSHVHIILKDKYDYTPICTDDYFKTAMNKMKPEFINAGKYFAVADRKYYVSKQEIINGELTIYALTSIGMIINQITNAVLLLIGILIILAVSIIITVKRQAEEKTKIIDQLVEAFSAVKNGNLDMRLTITTNNEFQIIGEAYNMMLTSLKRLIETNQETARATMISEIKQLESQFNPHFLFNTLENIKFMIKLDSQAASKMIIALSKLLRYSIDNNSSKVSVKEDLEYTKNYLAIQKYRFGSNLNYKVEIPEELMNCMVPKLMIQPIIENAVKYGFRDCQEMLVKIEMSSRENQLVIGIHNDGTPIDEMTLVEIGARLKASSNLSQHSGLYNVHRRIQLLYGKEYGLMITSNYQEGTTVRIVLPICNQTKE